MDPSGACSGVASAGDLGAAHRHEQTGSQGVPSTATLRHTTGYSHWPVQLCECKGPRVRLQIPKGGQGMGEAPPSHVRVHTHPTPHTHLRNEDELPPTHT